MGITELSRRAAWRIYQDFFMASRMGEYRQLLETASRRGYEILSVDQWAGVLAQGPAPKTRKFLIIRHDVDTDAELTLQWAQIERAVGAGASYFYRWLTMIPKVVEEVTRQGFHVSYHFEEIADYAKEKRLRTRQDVLASMPAIQDRFAANLTTLRDRYGWDMRIVCSHGDWVNRLLKTPNHTLLADPEFRRRVGVDYETYDAVLMDPLDAYFSDIDPPRWWRPDNPLQAVERDVSPIGILTHPKQWRRNVRCNTVELATRFYEGFAYRLPA